MRTRISKAAATVGLAIGVLVIGGSIVGGIALASDRGTAPKSNTNLTSNESTDDSSKSTSNDKSGTSDDKTGSPSSSSSSSSSSTKGDSDADDADDATGASDNDADDVNRAKTDDGAHHSTDSHSRTDR